MPESPKDPGLHGIKQQRSEEYFRRLFDEAPLGYQSLDETGRFLSVNQAWLSLLGYEKEEVLGRGIRKSRNNGLLLNVYFP